MNLHFFRKRPTAVYIFRYERDDGEFREINVPVGFGRFRRGKREDALELAERRLAEAFGDIAFTIEAQRQEDNPDWRDPGAELLRQRPDLHQDNYRLVSTTKAD